MKALLLIFSFYLLAISCLPCFCEDMQEDAVENRLAAAGGNEQHEEKAGDICNPFFACNCCPSTAFFHLRHTTIARPVFFGNRTLLSDTDQAFISYNSHAIWQPPRA